MRPTAKLCYAMRNTAAQKIAAKIDFNNIGLLSDCNINGKSTFTGIFKVMCAGEPMFQAYISANKMFDS